MEARRVFDLEDRLIDFAVQIIELAGRLPSTIEGQYFHAQIIRSGSAGALIYGEAQAAESRRDFIHKAKIILKELRETLICLKIIRKAKMLKDLAMLNSGIKESNELVAIFVKSIETAKANLKRETENRRKKKGSAEPQNSEQ